MQSIYRTIGDSLVGGYRARFGVYRNHDDQIRSGVANTGVGINDGGYLAGFSRRYGYSIKDEEGTLVGERLPDRIDVIQKVARHPFNPWGLIDNAHYVVTDQDMYDLARLSADGHFTLWDQVLVWMIPAFLPPSGQAPVTPPPNPPTGTPPPTTKPAEPAPDFGPAYKRLRQGMAAARGKLGQLPSKGGGTWLLLLRDLKVVLDGSADAAAELEPK